mmetsp:Transcript_70840/g.189045  ORF Transcript_70840/g.189045 Transcript_70840/m.189045 type:complete len:379 (+) Transcript_70840:15-1151(+)
MAKGRAACDVQCNDIAVLLAECRREAAAHSAHPELSRACALLVAACGKLEAAAGHLQFESEVDTAKGVQPAGVHACLDQVTELDFSDAAAALSEMRRLNDEETRRYTEEIESLKSEVASLTREVSNGSAALYALHCEMERRGISPGNDSYREICEKGSAIKLLDARIADLKIALSALHQSAAGQIAGASKTVRSVLEEQQAQASEHLKRAFQEERQAREVRALARAELEAVEDNLWCVRRAGEESFRALHDQQMQREKQAATKIAEAMAAEQDAVQRIERARQALVIASTMPRPQPPPRGVVPGPVRTRTPSPMQRIGSVEVGAAGTRTTRAPAVRCTSPPPRVLRRTSWENQPGATAVFRSTSHPRTGVPVYFRHLS